MNKINFQTMPLKFRVWDKEAHGFVRVLENGVKVSEMGIGGVGLLINAYGESKFIISQDTGLKDNNGKSIFTGDIVRLIKTEYDHIDKLEHIQIYELPVVCENGNTSLKVERSESNGGNYWILLSMQTPGNLEIVGNIWQNPELLEKK